MQHEISYLLREPYQGVNTELQKCNTSNDKKDVFRSIRGSPNANLLWNLAVVLWTLERLLVLI